MREGMRHDAGSHGLSAQRDDMRAAPRYTLLIRMAKLTCSAGEFLCVVRDVSETGASVKLFHPLPSADDLTLEMPDGDRHPLECVWEVDGKAGFRFRQPANVDRLVEGRGDFPKRPIRVRISLPAELDVAGTAIAADLVNLSQQGAAIRCEERLSIFQRVTMRAEGLPEIRAKVRWRRDHTFGLVFEDTFQFEQLALIVARLQLPGLMQDRAIGAAASL